MATVKDFSIEEKLVAVLTLQKIDSKIDDIKTLQGELPMEVRDLEDEIQGLQTRINNIDLEIDTINSVIAERTAGEKEAKAMIKKYEKQQENVKNSREFEAINKEIEMQELEVKLCEKRIKDATFELRDFQNQRLKTEEKMAIVQEALDVKQVELSKIIASTEKEEKVLVAKSTEAKAHVDERLLAAYDRIRTNYKNGIAVASVSRESCGGCFNVVPPQRQSEIRQRKKIITCEHCGRVLVDTDLFEATKIN
jgi:predicted  nucleic acid-binding Zn-ribbon protein